MRDVLGRLINQGADVEALGGERDGASGTIVGGSVDGGALVQWGGVPGDYSWFAMEEGPTKLRLVERADHGGPRAG